MLDVILPTLRVTYVFATNDKTNYDLHPLEKKYPRLVKLAKKYLCIYLPAVKKYFPELKIFIVSSTRMSVPATGIFLSTKTKTSDLN